MPELCDVAAERAVLAGVATYGHDAYVDVSDIVTSRTFTLDSNQAIYNCMEHILQVGPEARVDVASILSAAHSLGLGPLFDKAEERAHLRAVLNLPVQLNNVRRLAGKVRKLEIGRLLTTQLDAARGEVGNITGEETIAHILGLVENPIFDFTCALADTQGDGPSGIGVGARAYIEHLAANPVDMVGISTGFAMYDLAIGGGVRPKTVNLIGARPKTGKTMLADNMALHIAGKLGYPVLNLDTEMSKEDHWNRMIANLSDVEIDDIETGKFSQNDLKRAKVFKAIELLEKMPYDYLSIAGQPFEETLAIMRRWVMKRVGLDANGLAKPCVVIFDYLKLMSSEGLSKNLQEYQLLGFQMTGLHNFMVKYGTRCISFIQLNRDGITREDSDVASGSDRIVWLCSNFSLYKKKSDEEMAEEVGNQVKYNRKIVPIVARHGAGLEDGDYINIAAQYKFGRIVEGPTRNNLNKVDTKAGFCVEKDTEPVPFSEPKSVLRPDQNPGVDGDDVPPFGGTVDVPGYLFS